MELSSGDAIPAAASAVILPAGAVGTVHGLQGAPQYNGALGRVLEHDAAAGRYLLQLDDEKQLRVRRQNVRV